MDYAKIEFIKLLKANNLSITKPRMLVFEVLFTYGLQTVSQLIGRCPGVDRASIYRAVTLLEQLGAINRIPQGFKYKLELSDVFLPHHHHIVCQTCGRNTDVEQNRLEIILTEIAESEGYTLKSHKVELSGECPRCQQIK